MKAKKILLTVLSVLTAIVCACAVACKKDPEQPKKDTINTAAYGSYYCLLTDEEYTLTINADGITMKCTDIVVSNVIENLTGTYTYADGVVTITFSNSSTATATYDAANDALRVSYKNIHLDFIRYIEYTVTFNTDGGTAVPAQTVVNGKTAVKPADPVKDGYVFRGWYKDSAFKKEYDFSGDPITANTTLYARYTEQSGQAEYKIDFVTGCDQVVAEKSTVNGVVSDVPTLTREGYTFVGWWMSDYQNGEKLTAKYKDGYVFKQSTTLYAVWDADGENNLHVSVDSDNIIITNNAFTTAPYKVEIKNAAGNAIWSTTVSNKTYAYDFDNNDAGEYTVTVTQGSKTAKAYYKNKTLARVSDFKVVDGDVLMFNAVENADYYLITIVCGNGDHEHKGYSLGASTSYNFRNCDMKEGGIEFTVQAVANGYMTSESAKYAYEQKLGQISGLTYDAASGEVRWNAVANATTYTVVVNGKRYETEDTAISVRYETGALTVAVTANARGYVSSAVATVNETIEKLATPANVKIANNVITWDAVTGATGYTVAIGSKTYDVTGTSYTIEANAIAASKITVTAKAANAANNSIASEEVEIVNNANGLAPKYENGKLTWNYMYKTSVYQVKVNDGEEIEVNGVNEANVVLTQSGVNTVSVRSKDRNSAWQSVNVTAYKITYNTLGGVPVETEYKATGDKLTLASSEREGYDFGGWYYNAGGAANNGQKYGDYKFEGTSDTTLFVSWTPKTFKITLKLTADDENPVVKEVKYRRDYELGIAQGDDAAKTFKGWFSDPNGQGTEYTDELGNSNFVWLDAKDRTLYAGWNTVFVFTASTGDRDKTLQVKKGPDINNVSEVTVPAEYNGKKVTEINAGAFESTNLVKIDIPNTVNILATSATDNSSYGTGSAFKSSNLLKEVNVYEVEGNLDVRYFSHDGAVYEKSGSSVSLLLFPYAKEGVYQVYEGTTLLADKILKSAKITELYIPATVKKIGENAFDGSKLTRVVFEESLTAGGAALEIGDRAFKSCSNLTKLVLPSHLTEFNPGMILSCSKLAEIEVTGTNGKYRSLDGMLCETDDKGNLTIVYVPKGYIGNTSEKGKLVIPQNVVAIADYAFAVPTLPTTASDNEEYTYSGTTNLKKIVIPYTLETIGVGAFTNCTAITTLTLEEAPAQITPSLVIKQEAFAGCSKITTVTLPSHLKTLEKYAFSGATTLTTVTVNTVSGAELQLGAFEEKLSGNYYVTKVNIGQYTDVFDINGVFGGTKITAVNVNKNNPYISSVDGVLFDRDATKLLFYPAGRYGSYVIPETVTEIAAGVFSGKDNITKITIGKNIERIGDNAFANCKLLVDVVFEENGTANLAIGGRAFAGCTSLDGINLPARTYHIGSEAFKGCTGFTTVTIPANVTYILNDVQDDEGNIKTVFNIFDNCTNLTAINVVAENAQYLSVDGILYVKENCVAKSLVYAPVKKAGVVNVADTVTSVMDYAFYNNNGVTEVNFVSNAQVEDVTFGTEIFSGAKTLTKVTLPAGLTEIPAKTFFECFKLVEVNVPYTVTRINELAFYHCEALSVLTFDAVPVGVTAKELVIAGTDNVESTKYGVFNGCWNLTEVIFPERTVEIGDYAFGHATAANAALELRKVSIPSTIKKIGDYAFANCTLLSELVIAKNTALTSIGNYAFKSTTSLKSIELPESDNGYTIGAKAFTSSGITYVKIPASVKEISAKETATSTNKTGAFYNAEELKQIVIAEGIGWDKIEEYSFYGTDKLESINIPSTVKAIEKFAFYDAGKTSEKPLEVTLIAGEDGKYALQTIGDDAFAYTSTMETFVIPEGVTTISKLAFAYSGLKSVTIPSTVETIGESAFAASVNGGKGPSELIFAVDAETKLAKIKEIGKSAFAYSTFSSVTFPETDGEIQFGAVDKNGVRSALTFNGNKNLQKVHLSKSVTNITDVFTNCPNMAAFTVAEGHLNFSTAEGEPILYNVEKTSLVYVCGQLKGNVAGETGTYKIAEGIESLVTDVFMEQNAIVKVIIPTTVKTIGNNAFKNCENLEAVVFEDGTAAGKTSQLVSIGESAFYGCTNLKSINLPSNETFKTIEKNLFYRTSSLAAIELPEGITTISQHAFAYSGVEEITIPSTVTTLGTYVSSNQNSPIMSNGLFYSKEVSGPNVSALRKITLLANPENIGDGVFAYSDKLTEVILSDELTTIGIGMFYQCDALETIKTISKTGEIKGENGKVTLPSKLENIKNLSFSSSGVKDITIPASVKTIGADSTSGTYYLSPFYCKAGEPVSKLEKVTMLAIPEKTIKNLFYDCKVLKEVVLNDAMTVLPYGLFRSTPSLKTVKTIDLTKTDNPETSVDERIYGANNVATMPSQVERIEGYVFNTSALEEIFIGEKCNYIASRPSSTLNDVTFYQCDSLKKVTILGAVTIDKKNCFYSNKQLKEVVLNKNTKELPEECFFNSPLFDTLKLYDPETKEIIGNDGEVLLPYALTTLPKELFDTMNGIKTVIMSDAVTTIGSDAFYKCSNLTTIKLYNPNEETVVGNEGEARLPSSLNTVSGTILSATNVGAVIFTGQSYTKMTDYMFENNPMLDTVKYINNEGELVGENGVVTIPEGMTEVMTAIFGSSPIKKVILPSTLIKLGDGTSAAAGTFYNSTALEEVIIKSNNITRIDAGIFAGCVNLKKVNLPSNITKISDYMFYDCNSLEYILDATADGEQTDVDAYNTIVIPDSVTSIGSYAFNGTAASVIKLGTSINTIGSYAFGNCLNLIAFELSESNTAFNVQEGVLYNAAGGLYAYPAALDKAVVIPSGVTQIASGAFMNTDIRSIYIPNTVEKIGANAFMNTTNLREVIFEEGSVLKEIGNNAFESSGLREIVIPASIEQLGEKVNDNDGNVYDPVKLMLNGVFMNCTKLEKVTILGVPNVMSQGTFAGCVKLQEVILSDNTIEIPEYTFYGCNSLKTVKTVKDDVVTGSDNKATLPSGIKVIGSGAFSSTAIKSIEIPASVNILGDSANNYYKNGAYSGITYTQSNGKNGDYGVFYNCTKLETVKFLGGSIEMYDPFLFNGCTSLTSVELPSELTYIEEGTFYNCTSLGTVTIPDTVETIGWYAFQYSGINSIEIPASVQNFVSYKKGTKKNGVYPVALNSVTDKKMPFNYCEDLTTIVVNAKKLPNYLFRYSPNVYTVTLNGTETVGNYMFVESNVRNVSLGENITSSGLGTNLFKDCTNLKKITIPAKVTKISANMFQGCTSLEEVVITGKVTTIDSYAFEGCTAMKSFTIPSSVTKIGNMAFSGTSISEIVIPKTVATLGTEGYSQSNYSDPDYTTTQYGVFADCTNLTKVTFEAGSNTVIGHNTFSGCINLTTVVMNEGVKGIGSGAFAGTAITTVNIPSTVIAIGPFVFADCDNLTAITVAAANKYFVAESGMLYYKESKVVSGEKALITYPAGKTDKEYVVTTVDTLPGAFKGNDYLESVTLPENFQLKYTYNSNVSTIKASTVDHLGTAADSLATFSGCSALTTVIYQGQIQFIGDRMFKDAISLKTVGVAGAVEENKVILEGISKVGQGSFQGSGIEEVVMTNAEAMKSIGYQTTGDYTNYASYGSKGSYAKYSPFSGCLSLQKVTIDTPIASLPNCIFYNTPNLVEVEIPDTITRIGASAFEASGIREITLPSAMTDLGYKSGNSYIFADCVNLTKVTLPTSLNVIAGYNFYGCINLNNIVIPDTVTTINECAFKNCSSLVLTLPDSVSTIQKGAIQGIANTEFVLPAAMKGTAYFGLTSVYLDLEDAEAGTSSKAYGTFYGMKNLKKVDFSKSTIQAIPAYTFMDSGVTEVILPDTITQIGSFAYANTQMDTIVIPDTVTNIGMYAFMNAKIKTIVLPEGLTNLRQGTFMGAEIENIVIPGSVTMTATATTRSIEAFKDCKSLKTVVFEEGNIAIAEREFIGCTALETVTIPSTLTTIADDAFEGCTVKEFVVSADNKVFVSIDGAIYDKETKELVLYPLGKDVKDFVIPEGYKLSAKILEGLSFNSITLSNKIEDLGEYSFYGVNANAITLSTKLVSIGEYAFANVTGVTEIVIPATVKYIDAHAFDGWTAEQTIKLGITEAEAAKYGDAWKANCEANIIYATAE